MSTLRSFGSKKSDLLGSRCSRIKRSSRFFEIKLFPSDLPCIGFGLSAKHLRAVGRNYVRRFSKEQVRLQAVSAVGLPIRGFFLRSKGKTDSRKDLLRKDLMSLFSMVFDQTR